MKKKYSSLLVSALLLILIVILNIAVMATEADTPIIAYHSLADLVEESYMVKSITDTIDNRKGDIEDSLVQMKAKQSEVRTERNYAKRDDDIGTYLEATVEDRILSTAIKSYEATLESFDSNNNTRTIRQVKEQLTSSLQGLMFSYNSLVNQQKFLVEMAEIYQKQYELLQIQKSIGMATETDVSKAYANLHLCWNKQQLMAENENSIKTTLLLLLGYDNDADVMIGAIPSADITRIAGMNPEQDIVRAIANNYSLIDLRRNSAGTTTAGIQKQKTINEAEQNLYLNLESLYQEVIKAKQEYETVQIGFNTASLEKELADKKYNLGMLSELEYLSASLTYLQKFNEKEAADASLFIAMENYDWAVSGLGSINGVE